jgi:hypothetical protein
MNNKIYELIELGWRLYVEKVSGGLLQPENEKMLQLQLALVFQTLATLYVNSHSEAINILIEVPVKVRENKKNIIDLVVEHSIGGRQYYYPIELKCFRKKSRGKTTNRGAGNLSMYDFWEDIENIELYKNIENYQHGVQLTLTDDKYFVNSPHGGSQVKVYSTAQSRGAVSGSLIHNVANRAGHIELKGSYDLNNWVLNGSFYSIMQIANGV